MSRLYLMIFCCLCSTWIWGQDCAQNMLEADRAFYTGEFQRVIELLANCDQLRKNPDALELLTKSYLMVEEEKEADSTMFQFLSVHPLFRPAENDLLIFRQLNEQYEIRTGYNFGVEIGMNMPHYSVMQYQSHSVNTIEPEEYESGPGLSIGLRAEKSVTRQLFIGMKVLYERHHLRYNETQLDYLRLFTEERLNFLSLPIQFRYSPLKTNLKPYVAVGMGTHWLMNANADLSLISVDHSFTSVLNPNARIVTDYSLTDQRRRLSFSYLFTAGVSKSIGLSNIYFEFNYQYGLNNLSNRDGRFTNSELTDTYSFVSDDFKMDHWRISIGYSRSFVYPKKKMK